MATWLEDIVQAFKNLGGKASLNQLYEEVKRIRTEPLPATYKACLRGIIEDNSSDSTRFRGKDLFRKVAKGVWALRDEGNSEVNHEKLPITALPDHEPKHERGERMTTWVEDIIQALNNLGGQATKREIDNEVRKIRGDRLPKTWRSMINHILGDYSSDVKYFKGKDIFRKVDKDVWALRDQSQVSASYPSSSIQAKRPFQEYIPSESIEEITNILRTISQYRDYYGIDLSSWKEYVLEFFHILGFSTRPIRPQLFNMSVMGESQEPIALLKVVSADEYIEYVEPFSERDMECFATAEEYKLDCIILTNGIQMQILNYGSIDRIEPSYWQNIDLIIYNEQIDNFFSLYKALAFIRDTKTGLSRKTQKRDKRYSMIAAERFTFYKQLQMKFKARISYYTYRSIRIDPNSQCLYFTIGVSGICYKFIVTATASWIELEVNWKYNERNLQKYQEYLIRKELIEETFGESLSWQMMPEKKIARVQYKVADYGFIAKDRWEELQDRIIEMMQKFKSSFSDYFFGL